MFKKVNEALNGIRPFLQADGGDVELVEVKGDVAKVRLTGVCHGCPMAQMTISNGIERAIKEKVPAIRRVEQIE
ncbi:MAG: NifU family protein [Candidatus Altiarchaeota archaeon]|nr:NifU family protein [Candidatus Altiarchaeota archaeon]